MFVSSSRSFIVKSTSLGSQQAVQFLSTSRDELEYHSRQILQAEGGRCVSEAKASIGLFFMLANVKEDTIVLPFGMKINDTEILFDEVEPSPIYDDSVDTIPMASDATFEADQCILPEAADTNSTLTLNVEVAPNIYFNVNVTHDEYQSLSKVCENCFGYTTKNQRCKNRRQPLEGQKKVWCFQHKKQDEEYQNFQLFGDRPECCSWWG
jgi:hypothetical protein